MLFGNLTYEELKLAAKQDWLILVPTGCIEQQGPHLPVDFDTWFVAQVCISSSDLAKEEYGFHHWYCQRSHSDQHRNIVALVRVI